MSTPEIVAAGAVVWRPGTLRGAGAGDGGIDVCLIHRPRYDDWSLPKGKRRRGEHVLACAVREVEEETGYRVTLGRPLPPQVYEVGGRQKIAYYWSARAYDHTAPRPPDQEVDRVIFLPAAEAMRQLSHPRDAETVAALVDGPVRTTPLVLLRHAKSVARSSWRGPDQERPLSESGAAEAESLVPPLAALGLTRVMTSDAARCADTVRPFAKQFQRTVELVPTLSEDGYAAATDRIGPLVHGVLADGGPTVVCSHRPVLPSLAAAIDPAVAYQPLRPGGFMVIHHRSGEVVATETHQA